LREDGDRSCIGYAKNPGGLPAKEGRNHFHRQSRSSDAEGLIDLEETGEEKTWESNREKNNPT